MGQLRPGTPTAQCASASRREGACSSITPTTPLKGEVPRLDKRTRSPARSGRGFSRARSRSGTSSRSSVARSAAGDIEGPIEGCFSGPATGTTPRASPQAPQAPQAAPRARRRLCGLREKPHRGRYDRPRRRPRHGLCRRWLGRRRWPHRLRRGRYDGSASRSAPVGGAFEGCPLCRAGRVEGRFEGLGAEPPFEGLDAGPPFRRRRAERGVGGVPGGFTGGCSDADSAPP